MEDFILKLADAMEIPDASTLKPETLFKELDEWSSFAALSLIAMADEEYNKEISGKDIKNTNTVQDLYNIIAK